MTQITVKGLIATTPRIVGTESGLNLASFRLASGERRFDPQLNEWVYDATNWFTVNITGSLVGRFNTAYERGQIDKGMKVLVVGRLKIRDWENGERSGTAVEIDATSIGIDLDSQNFQPQTPTEAHDCNCNNCND